MFEQNSIKLGIAPIGWTNDDMPELGGNITFEQCVSEIALSGFKGTEIGNKFPHDVNELKKAIELRNIEIVSRWFSSYFTTAPIEETEKRFLEHRDFLHSLGAKVIVVSEQGKSIQGQMETSLFLEKPMFTDDEWKSLVTGLHHLGTLAKEKDMDIVYHHHMGTGIQTTEEIDRLMESTNPELVSLLYDTGHLVFSGENPVEVLKKYTSRIKHVHLKDIRQEVVGKIKRKNLSFLRAVKEGVFTVPGDGMIDYEPIFSHLAQSGYQGWFVVEAEQDPSLANPLEYALKARKYIKEKTNL